MASLLPCCLPNGSRTPGVWTEKRRLTKIAESILEKINNHFLIIWSRWQKIATLFNIMFFFKATFNHFKYLKIANLELGPKGTLSILGYIQYTQCTRLKI